MKLLSSKYTSVINTHKWVKKGLNKNVTVEGH